jgi:phosphomannomutase
MLYFAVHHLEADAGVMVTGSHNPSDQNGFKMLMAKSLKGGGPVYGEQIKRLADLAAVADYVEGEGKDESVDVSEAYVERLLQDYRGTKPLKAVWDIGNGAAGDIVKRLTSRLPGEHILLFSDIDGRFPNHHPDPTVHENLRDLQEAVHEHKADLGVAFDGDADRIGAIDHTGTFVSPHKIICLVARHLAEDRGLPGKIVKTVSTSVLVDRLGLYLGREVVTTPVGFKWIYDEMLKGDVLIGGEESGGIGVPVHVRERDALLMALMLAEMMGQHDKSLGELVEDLLAVTGPMEYQRYDMRLDASVDMAVLKAKLPSVTVSELAGLPVLETVTLDGVKFRLPDDAWLLLRASGTEPLVRVYAEASSAGVVDELLAAGRGLVNDLAG